MDIAYLKARYQESIDKAQSGADCCARRAHQGLAQLYLEKIAYIRAGANPKERSTSRPAERQPTASVITKEHA